MNLAQESIVMQPGDVEGDAAIIQQFKQFVDTFKSTFAGFYYKNTLLQLACSLSDLNNQRAALIFQQSKRKIATIWLEDLQSSAPRLMEELMR